MRWQILMVGLKLIHWLKQIQMLMVQ